MDDAFDSLVRYVRASQRILAVVGAGLSQPSGIPTFQGAGANWRGRPSKDMANSSAFEDDPIAVWTFYENRRQMCLRARPNAAHEALYRLSRGKPHMLTVTQNIDELSERIGHRPPRLLALHSSLFKVRCARDECGYTARNDSVEPTVPGLLLPASDVSDASIPIPELSVDAIPSCPQCGQCQLRPGIIWFGDRLPDDVLESVDAWLDREESVDIILVIGTSRSPYVVEAEEQGARVAYFNTFEGEDVFRPLPEGVGFQTEVMDDGSWAVQGDVAKSLPAFVERVLAR